jgi:hypothetical protein
MIFRVGFAAMVMARAGDRDGARCDRHDRTIARTRVSVASAAAISREASR